jgi:hypothetical protein
MDYHNDDDRMAMAEQLARLRPHAAAALVPAAGPARP